MLENALGGIVLTAQNFNPSIFTESWLLQHGILKAEDFVGARVYRPEVAQFQTQNVQVLVVPPRLQITLSLKDQADLTLPRKMADSFVRLLPETPYQSVGLNFDYFVSAPEKQELSAYSRALLGDGEYALLQEFKSPDARFGRYFSRNHGRARLKLHVLPVNAGPENKEMLQFSFNFHHDVKTVKRADEVCSILETWGDLHTYSQKLMTMGSQV